jgi:hypothetical protein
MRNDLDGILYKFYAFCERGKIVPVKKECERLARFFKRVSKMPALRYESGDRTALTNMKERLKWLLLT